MKNYFGNYLDDEDIGCKKTNVVFGILGKNFDIDIFSKRIGINPTHSFKAGDIIKTKTGSLIKRPYSLWNYSSEVKTNSTNINNHLLIVLEIFETKINIIEKFKNNSELRVYISIWWESKGGYGGYIMKSSLIKRICRLCNEIEINI